MKKRQYVKHIETAENYVAAKEYDKAIVAYRLAIKINKNRYVLIRGLAMHILHKESIHRQDLY